MPDYVYSVTCKVYVNYLGRTQRPAGVQTNVSNIGGYGPTQGTGDAASGQCMYFQQNEMVPNAIATPPTAANIGTALSTAATDIQNQITPAILAQIQNWSTGAE
jgi:hypothetical protein